MALRILFPYLKRYKLQFVLGPVFKLIEAIIELILPLLMAAIIDQGINGNNPLLIRRYGIIMIILVFLAVIFSFSCQYSASVASQGVGTRMREALFLRINNMSQTELQSFGTSSLINRVNGDVNQIQELVALSIRLLSRSPVIAVGGIILSFFINWRLAMILLLVVPVAAVLLVLIMRSSTRHMKQALVQSDKVTELFTDNMAGARVIRAFAREDHERSYFAKKADQLADSWIVANGISALMNPLTNLLFNAVIVFIIWRSGTYVNIGSLTQGEVLALVNYLTQIVAALMVWAMLASIFPRSFAAADRIEKVMKDMPADSSKRSDVGNENSDSREGGIDESSSLLCRDLCFTYPSARSPSLEGIHLTLSPGEELGIIGATGSGKSTLAKLLVGLYQHSSGELYLFGKRISDWDTDALRQQIAWIPQKAVLFKGTIRSNLYFGLTREEQAAYRNENSSGQSGEELEARMWSALEAAQAAEFVCELSEGLDTVVERGGLNYSGGQRQRLSIARALMRNAKLYIFDDSSSALDYLTDSRMRREVRKYTADAAVIRISNRVYQLLNVDRILVLDNGEQVALGPHKDLLKLSHIYREIAESQEGGIHAQ